MVARNKWCNSSEASILGNASWFSEGELTNVLRAHEDIQGIQIEGSRLEFGLNIWISEKTQRGLLWKTFWPQNNLELTMERAEEWPEEEEPPWANCLWSEMKGFSKQQQRHHMPLVKHGIVPASFAVIEKPCNIFIHEGINYKLHCPASCHKGPPTGLQTEDPLTGIHIYDHSSCTWDREQSRTVSSGWGSSRHASS